MVIPTKENKHQSDIVSDIYNNCAGQYSEEDEQEKRPTAEGCVSETAKIGTEKTN